MQHNYNPYTYYQGSDPVQASTSYLPFESNSLIPEEQAYTNMQASGIPEAAPAHPYDAQPSYPTWRNSECSTSSSTSSNARSPLSLRGSTPTSIPTPLTPLSITSPIYPDDTTTAQKSWFAAMQESYLANRANGDYQMERPSQSLQRMSISAPISSTKTQSSTVPNSNFLSVNYQPNRRASVVTYQPPTMSGSTIAARRPSVHQIHVAPAISQPSLNLNQSPQQNRLAARNKLTLEVPRVTVPTIVHQRGPSDNAQPNDVDRLFAEVFGSPVEDQSMQSRIPVQATSPTSAPWEWQQQHHLQPQQHLGQGLASPVYIPRPQPVAYPAQASSDNYNFAGVLLQPEDFHMLGPDPLSTPQDPVYMSSPPSEVQRTGWQPTFSFGGGSSYDSTPKTARYQSRGVVFQDANWTFPTFQNTHTNQPSVFNQSVPDRAASEPPVEKIMQEEAQVMDRRRGSSVDSAPLQAFSALNMLQYPNTPQLSYSTMGAVHPVEHRRSFHTSPAYLGAMKPSAVSNGRRATLEPSPTYVLPPHSHYPLASSISMTSPNTTARGLPHTRFTSPPASPTRRSQRAGSGSDRRPSATAPMFINFTSKDANKLLTGVAPSGSSKRKREEEEEARLAKLSKSSISPHPVVSPQPAVSPQPTISSQAAGTPQPGVSPQPQA